MTEAGTAAGSPEFHVLVLAAGASTRLGSPKQLAMVRGRPALQSVVATAVSVAGQGVTVVVGANAAGILPMLARTGASTVINRGWEEGLGASIRAGIAALPPACAAALLLLGDQVAVTADDLRRLVATWRGSDSVIAAALYRQAPGVPALFPRWCFQELARLRGDRGAKVVLQRHAARLVHVPMPNAAVDLDTREDLERLNRGIGDILRFTGAGSGETKNVPDSPASRDWSEETWLLPSGLALVEGDADDSHAAHRQAE